MTVRFAGPGRQHRLAEPNARGRRTRGWRRRLVSRFTRIVTGMIATSLLLSSPPGSMVQAASTTQLVFVAKVDNVYDPGEALQDGLAVDDLLRGTVTYDASARNSESRADV